MPLPMSIPEKGGRRFNPRIMPVAERVPPLGVIEHVGRRSGRTYRTPVMAMARRRLDGGVDAVFALPYGSRVDWVRIGETAGTLTLVRKGVHYRLDDLRLVHGPEALALLPWFPRTFLGPLGTEDVLLARPHRAS
ncbi:hypothetical protein [Luteimicrobium sp. DT211]|uniref:hypothetical protein n=1 Tax=Luteimicrobium sp. DT211 TaxID=3393412 RepID=UPI003CFAA172